MPRSCTAVALARSFPTPKPVIDSMCVSGFSSQPAMAEVMEDTVLPARASWSRRIDKGERLRIVDLEGKQAVDFLCYNAHDYADRYAAADTMKINPGGIFLSTGAVLYSVGLTPLFTIVADTCGKHDTIGCCCSAALNRFRYKVGYQPNCRDTFLHELA